MESGQRATFLGRCVCSRTPRCADEVGARGVLCFVRLSRNWYFGVMPTPTWRRGAAWFLAVLVVLGLGVAVAKRDVPFPRWTISNYR